LYDGIVLQTASVQDLRREGIVPSKHKSTSSVGSVTSKSEEEIKEESGCEDSGAAVLLFPPEEDLKWSLRRFLLACRVWILDRIDPAIDPEGDDSVSQT
jgi:hypothetical protein